MSLAPGATEMLFAAGAGDRIVATVEHSDEPPAARHIPRIGGAGAIDVERVVALRPDLAVVWPGGNNPAQIAQLERLGIPIYRNQVDTLEALPDSLRRLGRLAGTQDVAEAAAREIEARLERLENRHGSAERPSVLLQVWNRPLYTVGGRHLMSDALRLCGARNVFGDLREPGPAVQIEAVIARDPDMIIAIGAPEAAREWLAEWRRFGKLRAVRTGRLLEFTDRRLSRLGPSAVEATEALCALIDSHRTPAKAP